MDYHTNMLVAVEALLRRVSLVGGPFMVKGSILTRQFFPAAVPRFVQDADFVCLDKIEDEGKAEDIFSTWLIEVTETHPNDKVWFRSFQENRFWRSIDYAMHDDFPTTNTDLYCQLEEETVIDDLNLDISFNLDIDFPPEKMLYEPLFGKPFVLEKVCPYALQVSWKLHQLLVRPRLKDVFDLIYLLQHERFDAEELEKILFALKKECKRDKISPAWLLPYLNGQAIQEKEQQTAVKPAWSFGKNAITYDLNTLEERDYQYFTAASSFPFTKYSELLAVLQQQLVACGFREELIWR